LEVYRREGLGVLRYLRTRTADLSEAEDLHSETFCRAWQSWSRFRGDEGEIRPWLFRIARNLLIDRHRRRRLLWFVPLGEKHQVDAGDEVASEATGKALIHDLMGRISVSDRELVALRVAGLTHAEIGRIQGRSEQAVKIAWHRTLERVRGHLQGVGGVW
jgi:RNA polymerase sigma-70 factor, ECF subfamily